MFIKKPKFKHFLLSMFEMLCIYLWRPWCIFQDLKEEHLFEMEIFCVIILLLLINIMHSCWIRVLISFKKKSYSPQTFDSVVCIWHILKINIFHIHIFYQYFYVRFRASLYPCPETPQERKEMAAGVNTRIDDLQMVRHKCNTCTHTYIHTHTHTHSFTKT